MRNELYQLEEVKRIKFYHFYDIYNIYVRMEISMELIGMVQYLRLMILTGYRYPICISYNTTERAVAEIHA